MAQRELPPPDNWEMKKIWGSMDEKVQSFYHVDLHGTTPLSALTQRMNALIERHTQLLYESTTASDQEQAVDQSSSARAVGVAEQQTQSHASPQHAASESGSGLRLTEQQAAKLAKLRGRLTQTPPPAVCSAASEDNITVAAVAPTPTPAAVTSSSAVVTGQHERDSHVLLSAGILRKRRASGTAGEAHWKKQFIREHIDTSTDESFAESSDTSICSPERRRFARARSQPPERCFEPEEETRAEDRSNKLNQVVQHVKDKHKRPNAPVMITPQYLSVAQRNKDQMRQPRARKPKEWNLRP